MSEKNQSYIQAIQDVSYALQDHRQLEQGLSECLSILGKATGCENGLLWLYHPEDDRLYIVSCYGKEDATGMSISAGQGLVGKVFREKTTTVINDCQKDDRFRPGADEEAGIKTVNTLLAPLTTRSGVYGVLQLINKTSGEYTDGDILLTGNISALCALDIEDKGYTVSLKQDKKIIISLKGVKKTFPSGDSTITILKGIDLDIYEGEFLVILGESGCGKSTMLNIVGGMDSLSEGTLTVEGKDFSHPGDRELTEYRRDYIGFIFQSYNLMPNLSALENIEFVTENCKDPLPAEKALDVVGMSARAGHFPAQMSGGQQQRISIARALAKNPKVILADEPTAALDFQTGQEVLILVEKIVREQKKTVVMITHNAEIAKMADRVIKLRGGLISSVRINMNPVKAVELVW